MYDDLTSDHPFITVVLPEKCVEIRMCLEDLGLDIGINGWFCLHFDFLITFINYQIKLE